uniref:Adenosine 5'-phosphosulfate reductase n=1 Tax=OCS116 cluster bacterium TaxID=2030921 RepID=A0A2A4YUS3_9PROT
MELEKIWPAGAVDETIDTLSAKHSPDGKTLDLTGLLHDPLVGNIALVSSFGTEAAVLLHMVSQAKPDTDVLFIETGKHFNETHDYIETLRDQLGLTSLKLIKPDEKLLAQEDPKGELHKTNPDMCCTLRKSFPLQDAMVEYDGWITGRKRYHGGQRANLPFIEREERQLKINPLIHFSPKMIADYFIEHKLPPHPLLAQGFRSVGCAPCTDKTKEGDDIRSGRWAGVDKVECGIHLSPEGGLVRSN